MSDKYIPLPYNGDASKYLIYLRPAIERAIMSETSISYREHIGIRHLYPSSVESYCKHVANNFTYCPENKTFICVFGYGTGKIPIQLPLRYRDRFHNIIISHLVLNKLTK